MGSVNIDNTGSGADVTLSSDGTNLLLDGTAVGGLPELYAENPSSPTAPSATGTNAVAIGSGSIATGTKSIAFFDSRAAGADSFAAAIRSNLSTYGAKTSGSVAIGNRATSGSAYSVAIGNTATTSTGLYATAIGAASTAAGANSIGSGAIALGGSYASGADSFAAAIADNTSSYGATGANAIAVGYLAKASGTFATSIGYGTQATAGNAMSFGRSSLATGSLSLALGYQAKASEERSVAIGSNAKAEIKGKFAYAAYDFGSSAIYSQTGTYTLLSDTTDATPEAVTTNRSTASTDNQIILPNNSAYFFSGTIIARQDAASGTDMGAWEIKGAIRREGSAGTTTLVKSTIDEFSAPTGWSIALTADTTNGGLKIEVTGAAATNIRWVATVHTSEVTY